jgi:hypothetical protein
MVLPHGRALLTDYFKPLSLSGPCQANIEANELQRNGFVVGRDQRGCDFNGRSPPCEYVCVLLE